MIQHISHLTSEKNKKTKYNTIQYYSLKCKHCLARELPWWRFALLKYFLLIIVIIN